MPRKKVKTSLPSADDLLRWYDSHGRELPWRTKGGKRQTPYKVWLSEIMLQQTTVTAVIPYYHKFLQKWPTLAALAAADLDDVRAAWAGLGYYRRAANLHQCAKLVTAQYHGRFPHAVAQLKKLPGIGDYTAAALTAIAFDQPANVVDGNVERIMARIFMVDAPLTKAKAALKSHAAQLLPTARHGDYAQALMDLGATVCTVRAPRCPGCPWQSACGAFQNAAVAQYPVTRPKAAKPVRYGTVFWLENELGEVWLRKREEQGLLAGMIEVPSTEWCDGPPLPKSQKQKIAPVKAVWTLLPGQIRHNFTHFDLYLEIMVAKGKVNLRDGFWAHPGEFHHLALASVTRKIAASVLAWRK